jgi:hypothetical protein
MLTKDVLFGMNILTLAGFVVMGVGMTLNRQRRIRTATAFALMGAGTALAFTGIYFAPPTLP